MVLFPRGVLCLSVVWLTENAFWVYAVCLKKELRTPQDSGCLVPSHHVGTHAQSSCYFPELGLSETVRILHHRDKLSCKGFKAALMLCPGCLSCFGVWCTSASLCFCSQVWRPAGNHSHNFCIILHYLYLSVDKLALYLKLSVLC